MTETFIDFGIHWALTIWSIAKSALLGALIVVPCLMAWALCVTARRADDRAEELWDSYRRTGR